MQARILCSLLHHKLWKQELYDFMGPGKRKWSINPRRFIHSSVIRNLADAFVRRPAQPHDTTPVESEPSDVPPSDPTPKAIELDHLSDPLIRQEARATDICPRKDDTQARMPLLALANNRLAQSGVTGSSSPPTVTPSLDDSVSVMLPANDATTFTPSSAMSCEPPAEAITVGTFQCQQAPGDHGSSSAQTTTPSPASMGVHTHAPSRGCIVVAENCLLEPELPLPGLLQREWKWRIECRLSNSIRNSIPDSDFTIDCVMAKSTTSAVAKPTILLTCSTSDDKRQIDRVLADCQYIPYPFDRKVILHDINLCAAGDPSAALDLALQEGDLVEIKVSKAGENYSLFASLVKIYSANGIRSPTFSTIGGVITIDGIPYGLTTAHAMQNRHTLRQQISMDSSTVCKANASSFPADYFKVSIS